VSQSEAIREELIRIEAAIGLGMHALNGDLDHETALQSILRHLRGVRRRLEQELR